MRSNEVSDRVSVRSPIIPNTIGVPNDLLSSDQHNTMDLRYVATIRSLAAAVVAGMADHGIVMPVEESLESPLSRVTESEQSDISSVQENDGIFIGQSISPVMVSQSHVRQAI